MLWSVVPITDIEAHIGTSKLLFRYQTFSLNAYIKSLKEAIVYTSTQPGTSS